MKIVQINATCGIGSTGKICTAISEELTRENIENYILYNWGEEYSLGIKCATKKEIKFQALKSRIFGNYGFNSKKITKNIINHLEEIKPDIVHLHNIHGHDCNLQILVDYLKKKKIKIVWTFHDCWAFTGYCTHFLMSECDKWKKQCHSCEQYKTYSWVKDKSTSLYDKKKKILSGMDLTIVTPSNWLKMMVKQSYLKDYKVEVINNGININIFNYSESEVKEDKKKVVLGIAMGWNERKGLDVFIELANRLDCRKYQIVLVGTDKKVDAVLPECVYSIHKTQNQSELAKLYERADVFVNPTREDTFPTVNIEALACGTPVITFDVGGSPEIIDCSCGSVIERDNINALEQEIIRVCEQQPYSKQACRKRALSFNSDDKFKEYVKLYEEVLDD